MEYPENPAHSPSHLLSSKLEDGTTKVSTKTAGTSAIRCVHVELGFFPIILFFKGKKICLFGQEASPKTTDDAVQFATRYSVGTPDSSCHHAI